MRRSTRSAGVLLYRRSRGAIQLLIGHMGGPLWSRRDDGAWTVPKGEHGPDEPPLHAARREFQEEIGQPVPDVELVDLGEVKTSSGKKVRVWAGEASIDASRVRSNLFEMEWPPRSGRIQKFPEIDRAEWVDLATARRRLVPSQAPFVDRLEAIVGGERSTSFGGSTAQEET